MAGCVYHVGGSDQECTVQREEGELGGFLRNPVVGPVIAGSGGGDHLQERDEIFWN